MDNTLLIAPSPFAFLLAVTVVSPHKRPTGMSILLGHPEEIVLIFWRKLAEEMIYNQFVPRNADGMRESMDREARKQKSTLANFLLYPPFSRIHGPESCQNQDQIQPMDLYLQEKQMPYLLQVLSWFHPLC